VDAITLLKADHKSVRELFKSFEKSDTAAAKRKLVNSMIEELSIHAAIEEGIFYPAARAEAVDTTDDVLEALEEHHVVKWVLSELQGLEPNDERFDAKTTVLIELVRHHVEEEESEFFPKVRSEIGRKRLGEIGLELEAAKKKAPREPLPTKG
jgi:hemerythrin-like domain-containing protein